MLKTLARHPCLKCNGDRGHIIAAGRSFLDSNGHPEWEDCDACEGTGALIPGLWRPCQERHLRCSQPACGEIHCSSCSNGQAIVPEIKQWGPLIAAALRISPRVYIDDNQVRLDGHDGVLGAPTPNTLAGAILQALKEMLDVERIS